jgi:hypothetical protein
MLLTRFYPAIFAMTYDKSSRYSEVINQYNKECWLVGDYLLLLSDLEMSVITSVNLCVVIPVAMVRL